jgi:hypothetical protein
VNVLVSQLNLKTRKSKLQVKRGLNLKRRVVFVGQKTLLFVSFLCGRVCAF